MKLTIKKGFTLDINEHTYNIIISPEEKLKYDKLWLTLSDDNKEYPNFEARLKVEQKMIIDMLKIIFKDQYENEELQDLLFWGGKTIDLTASATIIGAVTVKLNAPAELDEFDTSIIN